MGHSSVARVAMAALFATGLAEPTGALTGPLAGGKDRLAFVTAAPAPVGLAAPAVENERMPHVLVPGFIGPAWFPTPAVVDPFPARTYGQLSGEACFRALDERGVPYVRVSRARGVDSPVRLTGLLHGVDFHSEPDIHRERLAHEILDCRLALALDDFAARLSSRGIVEAIHLGMYRGDLPTPRTKRLRHHVAALAIDMGAFVKADGTRIVVRDDWHGRIGAKTCGEGAEPWKPTSASLELRDILCDAANARLFHQMLTPNHDVRHADHFHLEVMRDTTWTLIE